MEIWLVDDGAIIQFARALYPLRHSLIEPLMQTASNCICIFVSETEIFELMHSLLWRDQSRSHCIIHSPFNLSASHSCSLYTLNDQLWSHSLTYLLSHSFPPSCLKQAVSISLYRPEYVIGLVGNGMILVICLIYIIISQCARAAYYSWSDSIRTFTQGRN
jgi:hypothetical protein